MVTFLKNRFPLVIICLLVFALFIPLNLKQFIYIVLMLTIVLLVHDLLHELGHAIAAILLGIKITSFSINRVYLEDEPTSPGEIESSSNKTKYGIIAFSGCVITTFSGYILLFIAHNLRQGIGLDDFFYWLFILIIFLLGDSGYLMTGSISMQGDPVGISAGLDISKWIVFSLGLVITVINLLLIWHCFWFIT